MTLNVRSAPHIRHNETTRTLMGDAVLVLLIIYAMAYYYYGPRALALGAWSVLISAVMDILCVIIGGKTPNIRDFSPLVTGMLIPLLMPATIPYSAVTIAAVVAIAVAKHPFGGVGHNVFNPAAAGFSFSAICYGEKMFTYPLPLQSLPIFSVEQAAGAAGASALLGVPVQVVNGISPAFTLSLGGVPKYTLLDMALGNFPGPMGATNILVILACLLYLSFRNTVRWEMPVSFFLTVSVFAFLFPRVNAAGSESVALELMSGMLLLGGVFMLGDPVTTPKRDLSKVAFGVVTGITVMLFRRYSGMEESFSFAILAMNATVWGFDMLGERLYSIFRRRKGGDFPDKAVPKKA